MAKKEDMLVWVISALNSMVDKKGSPKDVCKYVWKHYQKELEKSGDLLYTWQYDIRWSAQKLRNIGKLKKVGGKKTLPWELA